MDIIERIKVFFEKIFNRNQKLLDAPQEVEKSINYDVDKIKKNFEESLKVKIDVHKKKKSHIIVTLKCGNCGLGYQKIKV